jgi:twitching motility protein PilT
MTNIPQLFKTCFERNASDLLIAVGRPPVIKIAGKLVNLGTGVLGPADVKSLIYELLTDRQRELLEKDRELGFVISIPGVSRFRGNVHFQRGTLAAAFRLLPLTVPSMKELRIPETVLSRVARLSSGLVLVSGPAGSGKSTTLASVIDLINSERECHIITIEDPIEHLHNHKNSLVEQREIHEDTLSFASALKHVLRQEPDVILVGEMRDPETFSSAITAAEKGILVFSSLHTKDVVQTIDRIINFFPVHRHQQIFMQLAGALEGIICQQLLPLANEQGRIAACEVMVATDEIRALIRAGQTHKIHGAIDAGAKHGMKNMDLSLVNFFKQGIISEDTLLRYCIKPDYIKNLLDNKKIVCSS